MLEQKSPNVYAKHSPLRFRGEQEPQQFDLHAQEPKRLSLQLVLHERVAGHDPDAGTGMKLAKHVWDDEC